MRRLCLLVAALLLAGCADQAETITFDDPPSRLENTGGSLRHETGLETTYPAGEPTEPMFLWDGQWIDANGTIYEIGGNPKDHVGDCWESGKYGTAEMRCTENTLTRRAYRDGYDAAAEDLERALDTIGRNSTLWGVYCHVGGYAAAAGAVLGGEDPRTLMREKQSFCDYSVLHGVGSAVVSLNAADPAGALNLACAPDPASTIPEFSYGSQCWHGGGFGLARLYRLEEDTASRECIKAPNPGFVANCMEGVFSFLRYHSGRAAEWGVAEPSVERCMNADADLTMNADYTTVCYRAVAEKGAAAPESQRRSNLELLATTCPQLSGDAELVGCWSGVGNAVSLALLDTPEDTSLAKELLSYCAAGAAHKVECEVRAMIGMVKNPQRLRGIDAEDLILMAGDDTRDEVRERLLGWLDSIGGRSQ